MQLQVFIARSLPCFPFSSLGTSQMPAQAALLEQQQQNPFSTDIEPLLIMQGLTGSIAVCAALQGGQFMFTNILLGYTTGKGKVQSTTLWRGRLYFFAFLVVRALPRFQRLYFAA